MRTQPSLFIFRHLHPAFLLVSLLLVLVSCAAPTPAPVDTRPTQADPLESFRRGDYATAARLWQEKALTAEPSVADSLRISAADAWLLADEPNRAESLMRWIDKDSLDQNQRTRLEIIQADLAFRAGFFEEAAILLRSAQNNLPPDAVSRYEDLQLRVAEALQLSSVVDLDNIESLARRMNEYDPAGAQILIQAIQEIPANDLQLLIERPGTDPILYPWLSLAQVIRENLVNPEGLESSMALWKESHPDSYLTTEDGLDIWLNYRNTFAGPARVAILLPQSGRLKAAADAIRDGLMSAFLENPGRSQLLFINSGEESESIPSAYFEARELGADFIIGPIQPDAIAALLNLTDFNTPLLALNDIPADSRFPLGMSEQVQGISLSQDAEIRATASAMADAGYSRLMLLAPENEWGDRVSMVFSEQFLQEDRQIVTAGRFLEYENDHSAVLERMLQLDESKARKQQLENTLQMPVEFEPVRRDDIDVIFLVADSTQGRLIRPQLRFHNAGDIPVFATSRIYSGQPNKTRDQDLNGVRFPSSEMQINFASQPDKPQPASLKGGSFSPLFALGQDAWNILPWLEIMKADQDFSFPGQSGDYSAGPTATFRRKPQFAEFRNGTPVQLDLESDISSVNGEDLGKSDNPDS